MRLPVTPQSANPLWSKTLLLLSHTLKEKPRAEIHGYLLISFYFYVPRQNNQMNLILCV